MQIDLHHAMTWVVARDAGFSVEHATTIAYAGQYVDDATNDGEITFSNGAIYDRIATAHKTVDYRHLDSLLSLKVWVPFHFLPGNDSKKAGDNVSGNFINKLICRPGSFVAQDMVDECIADKHRPYGLHRLGITSHVFIDTWGHKGFAGVNHKVNEVDDIEDLNGNPNVSLIGKLQGYFQGAIPTLGHGQALSHPDLPHQKWSYTNGLGQKVVRNNTVDFLVAADELCKVYQKYQGITENGLSDNVKAKIRDCFVSFTSDDGEERHEKWLEAIANDKFGLGAVELDYIPKGVGSWKHAALGTTKVDGDEDEYEMEEGFFGSDWKLFHDAAKKHRLTIIQDILPKYGICVS